MTARRLGRGVVTVVPVSSSTDRVYPFQVLLEADESGLPRDSKAQAEQVRSVAVERIGAKVGRLSAPQLAAPDEALRLRSEERRVGKEGVSTGRSGWSPEH